MTSDETEALAALVANRRRASFGPAAVCAKNKPQRAFVEDKSRNGTACCGRGSGKTIGADVKLVEAALAAPGVNPIYVGATRPAVQKMAWKPLVGLNRDWGLGGTPNYTDLSITFPNGSCIYLLGVDSEKMADKVRGIHNVPLAIIDESQRMRDDVLTTLRRDVLRPALRDVGGALWMLGTPNPAGQVGEFWEACNNPAFSHHGFDIYANEYLGDRETIDQIIEEDLRAEGVTRESAWFQREYLARWVVELSDRVYDFDDERNVYDELPDDIDTWLVGVDVGAVDADAIAPLGWSSMRRCLYLVGEDVAKGQTDGELARKLRGIWESRDPLKVVIDAGGGGAKTLLTLQHMLPDAPLVAATKPTVELQVKTLNSLLKPGRLKVPRGSLFARDVRRARWVDGIVGGKVDETGGRHSDIVPAVRYAVLSAMEFLPTEDQEDLRTPEQRAADRKAAEREERMARARRGARDAIVDEFEDAGLGVDDPALEEA